MSKRITEHLNYELEKFELILGSDVLVYNGPIIDGNENEFLQIVEDLATKDIKFENRKISMILTTTGGSALAVERYVNILRQFYDEVNFIIPDPAFSAGTIFCMSGDNIYMDFFSVLGPIYDY